MFRQACSLFTYRRKSTALIVALIALAAFLMMSIAPLFSAVIETTMEAFFDISGEHHAVFFDITQDQIQQLKDHTAMKKLGVFENYGNLPVQQGEFAVTFGSYDETAIELGHLKVAEGRLPQTENEVALEDHLRYILAEDPLEIGDTLQVQTDDGEKVLTICGFMKDYTGQWYTCEVSYPGENDYPKAIVKKEALQPKKTVYSAMLFLYGTSIEVAPNSMVLRVASDIGEVDAYHLIFNDTTYWIWHPWMITPIQAYRTLFTILVLIAAGVLLYIALFNYFGQYDETATTLYSLGASQYRVGVLMLLWCGLVAFFGVAGGVLLNLVFAQVVNPYIGTALSPLEQWPMAIVAFAAVMVCGGAYYSLNIYSLYRRSYSMRGTAIRRKRRKKMPKDEIELGKGITSPMAAYQLQRNLPRMLCVCLLIAAMITVMVCINYDRARRQSQWENESGAEPALEAAATSGCQYYEFGEFEFNSRDNKYPIEDINKLYEIEGVSGVLKTYASTASLVFPQEWSGYANNLIAATSTYYLQQQDITAIPSVPKGIKATRYGYTTFVVDAWNQDSFAAAYPEIDIEKDLAPGKVVLLCPTMESASNQMGVASVSNDAFEAGDMLRMGMLKSDIDFVIAAQNPIYIKYTEESFPITKVLDRGLFTDESLRIWGGDDRIVIVMSEETAKQAEFIGGVHSVRVYMEEGLTEEQYRHIEQEFGKVTMRYSGSVPNSYVTEQNTFRMLRQSTEVVYTVLGVVLSVFIGFAVFSIIYGALLKQMRMFGILRSAGYTRRHLFGSVWLELLLYWVIAAGMSLAIGIIGLKLFAENILFELITGEQIWRAVGQIGIYVGALFILCILIAWLITRSVFKKSISSCIRFAE